MNANPSLVFSILLLTVIVSPAFAQTANSVVINELDINPPGDDSTSIAEWVELYNPTDSEIDLSGWEIASTTVLQKTMTIPNGVTIQPGEFLTYSYQPVWFTDSGESVELRDDNGFVVDKTPMLIDIKNDFTSWQRIYDGYGLDASGDWKFVSPTTGSSNGKLIQTQEAKEITVTVLSEKSSYLFGDTAVFEGSVSEEVSPVKPTFLPEPIVVTITGPDFYKTITLFPDLNLNYKTTLSLHQVLGINEGDYDVSVSYADATAVTTFSISSELIQQEEKEDGIINITTDKSQYLPGQTVSIVGTASEIIPFESMKFTVKDYQGQIIASGNLFPINGEFKTSIFLTTVNPTYGSFEIIAEYFDKSTSSSFDVVEDIREDVLISLWTDKEVYGLGDVVSITGRLNNFFTETLDLEIIQTKNLSLGTGGQSGGGSVLKILDAVRLDGDGRFEYSFTIPDSDTRLGDYYIKVSKDIGSVSKSLKVVENPETYVAITDPLFVTLNKSVYDFNLDKKLIISGQILNPVETSFEVPTVKVIIKTENGQPLEIIGLPEGFKRLSTGGISVGYEFTAIPEASGFFSVNVGLERLIFSEGKYIVEVQYQDHSSMTHFEIVDLLNLGDPTVYASLDKSVYGLGETLHLSGTFGAQTTDSQGITINVHKPGGDIDKFGTTIDSGFFSWDWITPVQEKTVILVRDRSDTPTNLGIYRVHLDTEGQDADLFFKLSLTPETDELVVPPLFVSTSKSLYKAGETLFVEGTVNKRIQGTEGLIVPERVTVRIMDGSFPFHQILESSVYPDEGGNYKSNFELPITVFSEGEYKVKAIYEGLQTEHIFGVVNDFAIGIDEPVTLLVSTDKSEYYPGETVTVSGIPNKLIYLEAYEVSVIQKNDIEITCGSFICGTALGPVTSIFPSPTGSFTHHFIIPDSLSAIGRYEVTVDADFETKHIPFNVLPTPKIDTVIEKQNRISETIIPIITEEKNIDAVSIAPRVLSGSLLTPSRGDDSSVNLRVSSVHGTCIIGPDADCLVKESTRKPGQIYDVVEVDGLSLNVRYSGSDVRLEKFSIVPESSTTFLPDITWNVDVIKDEQVSRFYYKVTYKALE
jgi:hypothetical protein